MSRARMTLLPMPEHCSQSEADALLHKQLRLDAEEAGWLKPCTQKPGKRRSLFYRTRDVQEVSRRVAEGEYPGVAKEASAIV